MHSCLARRDGLWKREECGSEGGDAFLFEDDGGLNSGGGSGDLDTEAVATS